MIFFKPLPLADLLIEAKVAAGTRSPLVVFWQAEPRFFENLLDVCDTEAVVAERINRNDVLLIGKLGRLFGLISVAVLVSSNTDVAVGFGVANILFKRLNFEFSGTPTAAGAWKVVAVKFSKVDVEGISPRLRFHSKDGKGVDAVHFDSKERLQALDVLIGLGQLHHRIAEDVLRLGVDLRVLLPDIYCQRSGVLTTRNADDVSARFRLKVRNYFADLCHNEPLPCPIAMESIAACASDLPTKRTSRS